MKRKLLLSALVIFLGIGFNSCKKEMNDLVQEPTEIPSSFSISSGFPETFESGTKTSYTAGDVSLPTGLWNLDNALIGTLSNDRKNGTKSVRIQSTGKLTMKFNVPNGASSVSILHGAYGTDASSTWQLWYSINNGSSWTQTGSTITTSTTSLQTATFPMSITGSIRFEIRKISGGTNRINIDDITINDNVVPVGSGLEEAYESGTKTSYAAATVTLSSGNWYFDNALLGTTTSDRKNGTKSARINATGKITMQFDVSTGTSGVTIKHAKYGSDANSTWQLWYSTNGGSSWIQTGSTITTSSTTLQTATFSMSIQGNVRFEIRKITGTSTRLNIDDFLITTNSGGGGGGTGTGSDGDHMAMGNPSGATTSTSNENNYLMEKVQYKLSYNRSRATANWVSWYVGPEWLGSTPRQDDFRSDNTLPSGWYQVGATNYSNSGFDRGHNCPSADRTSSVANNSATFLMTNMIPQAPVNNQQTWANLENYTRTLVSQGNEVYVIMGCYGVGGTGSNGSANTINNGNITVPSNIWKVLIVLPQGTNDVSRVSTSTRIIAINTPNINTTGSWGSYRTTVDAIEAATGYDILSNVSTSIQSVVEATVDNGPTQ